MVLPQLSDPCMSMRWDQVCEHLHPIAVPLMNVDKHALMPPIEALNNATDPLCVSQIDALLLGHNGKVC